MEKMHRPIRILVICKSGRLDCLVDTFYRSPREKEIYVLSEVRNSSLCSKAVDVHRVERTDDRAVVRDYAEKIRPDFVFIGPEEPLEAGIVDELEKIGIPAIGPTQELAKIETSKSFARGLLTKYKIPGNPQYKTFFDLGGLREYLDYLGSFVIKPDGLTGGKGVKVFGEHLHSIDDALRYCEEVFDSGQDALLVEEKLEGEEFSFQSFCDGVNVVHTIPVQDHKRSRNGDQGPNTGGMGSYSCENHLLPFLQQSHVDQAGQINAEVAKAILRETGKPYKGILYGSFMVTRDGLRVIEYNARFGDPEIMNVLPLLKTDLIDISEAIIAGKLSNEHVQFCKMATVCKYIVPKAYPDKLTGDESQHIIGNIPLPNQNLRVYFASVNGELCDLRLTGSRAIAVVGIGYDIAEAEKIAEAAACQIEGPVRHRTDIGTSELISRRIHHIKEIQDRGDVHTHQPIAAAM